MRILVAAQRPSEDERKRDEAHAGDVRAMIEPRRAGALRQRDAEFLPQLLAGVLELLDGGAEHVLGDHEPRVRRHDQALRPDQAVRDVARVLVQERDRGHQLANEAQRRVDVELQVPLGRDAQNLGQPRPLDVVRHDRETARIAIDAADARVVCVTEVGEARRAFAQRELERRNRQERGPQAEDLKQVAGRVVDRDDAIPQTIGEQRRFRTLGGHGDSAHGIPGSADSSRPAVPGPSVAPG